MDSLRVALPFKRPYLFFCYAHRPCAWWIMVCLGADACPRPRHSEVQQLGFETHIADQMPITGRRAARRRRLRVSGKAG